MTEPRWRTSSASNPYGNCVQVADLADGRVGMRNSRDPDGTVLSFPAPVVGAFLDEVRAGALDESPVTS